MTKVCKKCKLEKEFTEFSRDRKGYASKCKTCFCEYATILRERLKLRSEIIIPYSKECTGCGNILRSSEFFHSATYQDGLSFYCKKCSNLYRRQARIKEREEAGAIMFKIKEMLDNSRVRANKMHLPFDLDLPYMINTFLDVSTCLYLGRLIDWDVRGSGPSPMSPTLDRIVPQLGYVKGNVQVISHQANKMKNNASFEDLRTFSLSCLRLHPSN